MGKILVAYHDNCIDGMTAAWVVYDHYTKVRGYDSNSVVAVPVQYNSNAEDKITQILQDNKGEFETLYVVDFSFKLEVLMQLSLLVDQIHMYDHHRTAMKMYCDDADQRNFTFADQFNKVFVYINQDYSGATLTWHMLNSLKRMPEALKCVADYDLWKFEIPTTKEVNKFLRTVPMTLEDWDRAMKRASVDFLDIVKVGSGIHKYHEQLVDSLVATRENIKFLEQYEGLVVNCPPAFASDVGHKLAKLSGTFGATWHQNKGDVIYSLRSVGDFDVSAIAEQFGGGGHKNAAGFKLTMSSAGDIFPDEDNKPGVTIWHT